MGTFLIRRLFWGTFTVFCVTVIVFVLLIGMGDDPALRIAGKNPTPELVEQIRKEWRLDKSMPVQYAWLMGEIFKGDLKSASSGSLVVPQALAGVPVTFALAMTAAFFWLSAGVLAGIKGAKSPGSRLDRSLMIVALAGISVPMAWLSLYSLKAFTSDIPLFPAGGYVPIAEGGIFLWLWHIILPGATLAVVFSGVYARMTRSNVRMALQEEYIKTAVAKGLPERQVFRRHVLRTGLIPIVVLFGLDFGALLGGAIFTETIFGLPGLGNVLMMGIGTQDIPVILVGSMFAATFVVLANIFADIVQAAIDPRVRLA